MSRGPSTFRQVDLARCLKAAKAAGVAVRIEIERGKITVIPSREPVESETSAVAELNEWDGAGEAF